MNSLIAKCVVLPGLAALLFPMALTAATSPVTVSVNTSEPGAEISPGMVGLSYETSRLLPDPNGVHYFRPDNKPLLAMFKTIGVKSLRLGGNSVDAPKVPMPDEQDVTAFFDFARAAGVKVIYSVRLEESTNSGALPPSTSVSNARYAAKIAKLIHDHYADVLDCFAIGNEPYYFKDKNYAAYPAKWKAIHDAIVAVYPEARFCGPDQNPSPSLDQRMVRDFGNASNRLVLITQHSYPFGCAYTNPAVARTNFAQLVPFGAAKSRRKMLSPNAYKIYDKIYKGIESTISGTSVSYRLTEVNSFWFSGLKGASDSYASALWAADYLHWWADHGAAGVDFHTGDRTGGELSMPCRYTALITSRHGYEARPLAYGMKLFDLGGYGKELPATVVAPTKLNLVAYATLSEGNTVAVTLINKTHGPKAKKETVQIRLDRPLADSKARVIFLRSWNNYVGGGSAAVKLGGARIKENGSWRGRWKRLRRSAVGSNVIVVKMPPASAAVVKAVIH